jgi:hypothetical protein
VTRATIDAARMQAKGQPAQRVYLLVTFGGCMWVAGSVLRRHSEVARRTPMQRRLGGAQH